MAASASDKLPVTVVVLKEVQVGPIRQTNVRAVITEGDYPRDVLLGMTFLQHVDISENAGLMVLTSKL
jgi:aspartyl protease family protein